MPNSPLPDARALEAGILEDELPSRLSRVQENVRNLLRNSHFISVQSSPPRTPTHQQANVNHGLPTPPTSPQRHAPHHPEVVPSPTAVPSPTPPGSSDGSRSEDADVNVPPSAYQRQVQQMAHQSAMFNTRAVAALNHPDLTDPSLAAYVRQKTAERQRKSWKRPARGRKRSVLVESSTGQVLLPVFAALSLAAIVATYVVLATTTNDATPTFHILFILGIILATIVFAHSVMRLLLFGRAAGFKRKTSSSAARRKRHRHHRDDQPRIMPALPSDAASYSPEIPIQVHMPCDEVRPDSREAEPTATVQVLQQQPETTWDKDVDTVSNPPPAYGRWRGSVRANPDLLHWQAVPSPVVPVAEEALPSPRYEEAAGSTEDLARPPSYVTRDSPARRRAQEGESGDSPVVARVAAVESEPEPEMFEVRGVGLGV